MKVAVIGATGAVGSRLMVELVRRGHQVTGIIGIPPLN
jgi:putative NADH-flavin reductase